MPEFRILGPLEVAHSDQPLTPTPPKIRSVLALLLLRANRIVSVESLIEELWGPKSPRSAVTTVQVGSDVSGPIKELFVDFNSPVEQGQRVAKIDPAPFATRVKAAEANLSGHSGDLTSAALGQPTSRPTQAFGSGRAARASTGHAIELRLAYSRIIGAGSPHHSS